MHDINEIFQNCLWSNNTKDNSILELTNYIYRRSMKNIKTQKVKWHIDDYNDDGHFFSVTYTIVLKNINKYRVIDPNIKFEFFTSICMKEVKLSVNNFNRNLISNGHKALTQSIPIQLIPNNKTGYIIETKEAQDKNVDIENETINKSILSQIINVVNVEQAAILAHRLQGLSFEEIASTMHLSKDRVIYLFYTIKNNPEVKKIYKDSKLWELF